MPETSRGEKRRVVRFNSIDDAIREADRIADADVRGKLRPLGNWTAAQCLNHVAAWIEYGYDGYPIRKAPWFIRAFLRWRVRKYLRDGLPAGVRMPGPAEGTFGIEDSTTADAANRFREAFLRLARREESPYDSPGFGPMSHDDRIELNLRHAELHLSFLDILT